MSHRSDTPEEARMNGAELIAAELEKVAGELEKRAEGLIRRGPQRITYNNIASRLRERAAELREADDGTS